MDEIRGTLQTDGGSFVVTIRPAEATKRPARRSRQNFPKTTRIRLLNAQDYRCALCRGPMGFYDSHIDHIIPRSAGGRDDFTNLQLTHMSCNLKKGAGRSPYDQGQERMPWA